MVEKTDDFIVISGVFSKMPVLNLQRSYKYIMYATKQPSLRINQADLKCKTGCGYYGTAECDGEYLEETNRKLSLNKFQLTLHYHKIIILSGNQFQFTSTNWKINWINKIDFSLPTIINLIST